jgi:hypothetical protein
MRSSTHDDCITRRIADRLIARLSAQRGLRWPDDFNADAINNLVLENLGKELILWRLEDLIRGMRYANGIEMHENTVETLQSEALDFLAAIMGAPDAADEIRRRGLALEQQALEK